jgi:hypothetical protein
LKLVEGFGKSRRKRLIASMLAATSYGDQRFPKPWVRSGEFVFAPKRPVGPRRSLAHKSPQQLITRLRIGNENRPVRTQSGCVRCITVGKSVAPKNRETRGRPALTHASLVIPRPRCLPQSSSKYFFLPFCPFPNFGPLYIVGGIFRRDRWIRAPPTS